MVAREVAKLCVVHGRVIYAVESTTNDGSMGTPIEAARNLSSLGNGNRHGWRRSMVSKRLGHGTLHQPHITEDRAMYVSASGIV